MQGAEAMMAPMRENLLDETKRLLAALNDENRELKGENTRLLSRCKAAKEEINRIVGEKEGLEKDLKQINFNLMQQLRVKVAALKEQERLTAQLQEKVVALESHLQESRLARESSSKESMMQREQIQVLESRVQQLMERQFRTEAEAGRYAEDLNAAIAAHRETTTKIQHDGAQRLKQVEEALRVSRNNEVSLERIVEELRYELGRAKDVLRQSHNSSHEGHRRSLSARSEAIYAHEQLLTTCSASHQQLRDLQQQLRAMAGLTVEANNCIERTLCEWEARLKEQVKEFVTADDALVTFLCQTIVERGQELRAAQEELLLAQQRLGEAGRELELQRATVHAREVELQSMSEAQRERERAEEDLRAEAARWRREAQCSEEQAGECRRKLRDEREQSEEARRFHEQAAESLDERLQEFTAAVSQALRRLGSATHHRRSQRSRLSSKTGDVVSMHSTELIHDGGMSPSVLRVETSPLGKGGS